MISLTKTDLKKVEEVLAGDYEDIHSAATIVSDHFLGLLEKKISYVLVAANSNDEAYALGFYSTRTQAENAGKSMSVGKAGEFLFWVMPIYFGTPAQAHAKIIADREARQKSIDKHTAKLQERIAKWCIDNNLPNPYEEESID